MTRQVPNGASTPVGDRGLHVVFGVGQVGSALVARLAGSGLAVRAVSRHRPPALFAGVEWRAADLNDSAGTPLADAITETVAWYRSRTDAP